MTHKLSLLNPRGNAISVTVAGEGMPLMLLHGFPLDHRMWAQQIDYFQASCKVIAPDFRGFGDSTLGDAQYSLSELAEDVEFVRRHLSGNTPIILCGLSMGGYVAFEYWSRYSAHLKGLVFANTKPNADSPEARDGRLKMADYALQAGTQSAVAGMLEKLLSPGSRTSEAVATQENLVRRLQEMMYAARPEAIAFAQRAMAAREDFEDRLPQILVPSLVLTGEADTLAPVENTQRWAAKLPNSKFHTLPDSGHLSPMEVDEQFNEQLKSFVSSIS